jgi:hypothetical protein
VDHIRIHARAKAPVETVGLVDEAKRRNGVVAPVTDSLDDGRVR